jgi:hypothetical protein
LPRLNPTICIRDGHSAAFQNVFAEPQIPPVIMRLKRQQHGDGQQGKKGNAEPEKIVGAGRILHGFVIESRRAFMKRAMIAASGKFNSSNRLKMVDLALTRSAVKVTRTTHSGQVLKVFMFAR